MAFDLTINRIGAVVASGNDREPQSRTVEAKELVARFRRQVELILSGPSFHKAGATLLEIVRQFDSGASYSPEGIAPEDEIEPIEVFSLPLDSPSLPLDVEIPPYRLMSLLPSRKIQCVIDGRAWILRTRASIVAVTPSRPHSFAQLWWTCEGIPAHTDPNDRPDEKQAASFISVTNDMATLAMPCLYEGYRDALFRMDHFSGRELSLLPERICVSLGDNDDRPFAALVDVMSLSDLTLYQVQNSTELELECARDGVRLLTAFVHAVMPRGAAITDDSISLHQEIPGVKGLVYQDDDKKSKNLLLAGLARTASARGGYRSLSSKLRRAEKSERYLRTFSAARLLSAFLAGRVAALLDDRLTQDSRFSRDSRDGR